MHLAISSISMNNLRLRELRLAKGLTQEQLAELASVSQPMLSQIELGQANPSLKAAQRLAEALEVSVDSLIAKPAEAVS